ncbi:hypothetical protein ABZR86_17340 [Dyella marensis]|uniref:Uncharacterized protein n=1 Tax=Dyella marensis TaxID=500610 RepID=A0A1I2JUC5_9GAMM|nr:MULTISPECIES: hypothetical protein [Dyella]SFF57653.1 hypothetical protein SAMN02799615_04229 [Dyella marensis]
MRRTATRLARGSRGWLALSCLLLPLAAQALPPPERLEWHGRTYELKSDPLAQRYAGRERPRFMPAPLRAASDDERGYSGRWRLEDDRLYLVDIDTWLCLDAAVYVGECHRATLPELFGVAPGKPVFAEWYSGELVLPDALSSRASEPAIRITLKAGRVTRIERVDPAGRDR